MRPDVERRAADELAAGGRILVSRLQYLGDVILTLPAVRAIRERYPRAEIDYLSRTAGAAVLEGEPLFARVIRVPERPEGFLAQARLIAALRARRRAAPGRYARARPPGLFHLDGGALG